MKIVFLSHAPLPTNSTGGRYQVRQVTGHVVGRHPVTLPRWISTIPQVVEPTTRALRGPDGDDVALGHGHAGYRRLGEEVVRHLTRLVTYDQMGGIRAGGFLRARKRDDAAAVAELHPQGALRLGAVGPTQRLVVDEALAEDLLALRQRRRDQEDGGPLVGKRLMQCLRGRRR